MVIRRIREHVAAHNWFAVGIDLAIVVAGVFLGTQVNNWNERRIEEAQVRDYRDRLIRELDFNARQFRAQIGYYRQVKSHGLAAVRALDGEPVSPTRFLLDSYQLSQIDTSAPKSYIYEEMVNSGLVPRLGDEKLQDMASDYYLGVEAGDRTLREIFPYRSTIRQLMPFAMQDEIRARCGDQFVHYGERIVGVSLPSGCKIAFDPSDSARAAESIRSRPGLHEEMTRYVASIDEKLDALALSLNETERFMKALKAAD